MSPKLDDHLAAIVQALAKGELVPFLGAGANLVDRPEGGKFNADSRDSLPTGMELAQHLASQYGFEDDMQRSDDLLRVAERIRVQQGEMAVYNRLSELLDADYPMTSLHAFLAALPAQLRQRGWKPLQLIVTTNYDDLLERSFEAAGEDVDMFVYMAAGRDHEGKFMHFPPSGEPVLVQTGTANEYLLDLDESGKFLRRPSILKLHGTIDRKRQEHDSFVISEDDYIDYLARVDLPQAVPARIRRVLAKSAYLFLGYSLKDWNVRAILREIWDTTTESKGWAIQIEPSTLDVSSWKSKNVDIVQARLDEYVAALSARMAAVPTVKPASG